VTIRTDISVKICHPERSEGSAFRMRCFYVYIMASKSRVLYTGITNDIRRRTGEHKDDLIEGFTSDYKVHRLVYFETFKYVGNAIAREKRIKGWLRKRKIALVESVNPTWQDLGEEWFKNEKQVLRFAQDDK
jgi:putative endonuclease